MSVRTAILGYLFKGDLHGYDLKKRMEAQMADFADIKFGSIYYALGQLEKEGLVAQVRSEQDSSRPARTVYRITKAGRTGLQDELLGLLSKHQRIYFPLDIALFFSKHLDKKVFLDVLRCRLAFLEGALEHVNEVKKDLLADENIPEMGEVIVNHSLSHIRAEISWLVDLIGRAEKKDLFQMPQTRRKGDGR
jgi:DNA-binding PadR family transcriptional regulator